MHPKPQAFNPGVPRSQDLLAKGSDADPAEVRGEELGQRPRKAVQGLRLLDSQFRGLGLRVEEVWGEGVLLLELLNASGGRLLYVSWALSDVVLSVLGRELHFVGK